MDLVTHICLDDFHDTTSPLNVKTYPLMDFETLVSNIQLTS